jgi:hypothetical protein
MSRAEIEPSAIACVRHLLRLGHRLVITSLIPDGVSISESVLDRLVAEIGATGAEPPGGRGGGEKLPAYGRDYVILGYKAGNQMVITQACNNFPGTFPVDIHGTPYDDIPVLAGVHDVRDFALVFTICDNNLFDHYASIANTIYGRPVAGATTAVMMPELMPYLDAGQLLGVVGGLRGGAEYEALTGVRGDATAGMSAQSVVHLFIVALIVAANVSWFAERRART